MIKRFLKQWRTRKAVKRWNANLEFIQSQITNPQDEFKWGQLVWQEVWMWIALGVQVTPEEFDLIAERRGFTSVQRRFLSDMMIYVGLGRHLCKTYIE